MTARKPKWQQRLSAKRVAQHETIKGPVKVDEMRGVNPVRRVWRMRPSVPNAMPWSMHKPLCANCLSKHMAQL